MARLTYLCPDGHERTLSGAAPGSEGNGHVTQLEMPCLECGKMATLANDPAGTETKNFYKKVVYVVAFLASGGIFVGPSHINAGLVATALTWAVCVVALYYLSR